MSNGELDKAKRYLDSASGVSPQDKGVALARGMMKAARASRLSASSPVPETVLAAPRRVAVLPFWGRQNAPALGEGADLSVEISEFAHNFLRNRSSLELIYSYYQPGFDHATVNRVGDFWTGGAVSKEPRMGALRDIGRQLGADGVLVFGYEPRPGAGAEVHLYLVGVGDGRVISRKGDLENLAEITRESFEDWNLAPQ